MKHKEMLKWVICYSATVHHDRDGEMCYVEWYPKDWEWDKQKTDWKACAYEAIKDAMKREFEGDWK